MSQVLNNPNEGEFRENIEEGDVVIVPIPKRGDSWIRSFSGIVVQIDYTYATVRDPLRKNHVINVERLILDVDYYAE